MVVLGALFTRTAHGAPGFTVYENGQVDIHVHTSRTGAVTFSVGSDWTQYWSDECDTPELAVKHLIDNRGFDPGEFKRLGWIEVVDGVMHVRTTDGLVSSGLKMWDDGVDIHLEMAVTQ
jgi:hypothetical protein